MFMRNQKPRVAAPGEREMDLSRREFLVWTAASAVTASVGQVTFGAASTSSMKNGIPYNELGSTGQNVSRIGLGGYHMGKASEKEAIEIVRTAIDNGINFMDNAWDYHDGRSENYMGKALRDGYREKVFLMTKIDGQTKRAASKQMDESLARLRVDYVDLMQCHEVIRMGDPERIFGADGAFEALREAKKAGKIRFIGFTGHKSPAIHRHMLDTATKHGFKFDAVQFPVNVMDAHHESFQKRLLPRLVEENIGRLGMKPMGGSHILESKTVSPKECLHYAMSLSCNVVITGCDSMKILEQALDAARTFKPLSPDEMAALEAKTVSVAKQGEYEKYKTSEIFDSTAKNPEWLG
jgi:aryl-alcohol dehydrogenase-like predicted oxidoreductase